MKRGRNMKKTKAGGKKEGRNGGTSDPKKDQVEGKQQKESKMKKERNMNKLRRKKGKATHTKKKG